MISRNKYDYFIMLIIASLIFGTMQVSVVGQHLVVGLFCLPFALQEILSFLYNNRTVKQIVLFMLTWLIYATLSLLWTINEKGGLGDLWTHFWMIILFLGTYNISQKALNPTKSIITGWLLLFCLTFPIAFWEITTGNHIEYWGTFNENAVINTLSEGRTERAFAAVTYRNLNSYVTLLCLALPFVFTGVFTLKKKIFPLLIGFLAIIIVVINASRGGLISVSLSFILFFYFLLKVKFPYKNLFICFFLLLLLAVIFLYGESILDQLLGRLIGLEVSFLEDIGRWDVLRLGWQLSLDSGFLGWGVGSMQAAYASTGFWLHFAHNFVMEFLLQYGICLLIWLLFIYGKYIKVLYRSEKKENRFLALTLLITFLPVSIIDDTYLTHPFVWMYLVSICIFAEWAKMNKLVK